MKNICVLCYTGGFGDTTHAIGLWKEMSKASDYNIFFIAPDSRQDFRTTTTKLTFKLLPFASEKNFIKFAIMRLYFEKYSTLQCLLLKPSFIYSRYRVFGVSALLSAKIKNIPLVSEVNGLPHQEIKPGTFQKIILHCTNAFDSSVLKNSTRIICTTETIKDDVSRIYGIPREKIYVSGNATDTALFRPHDMKHCRNILKIDENAPVVCFIGRFAPWQGIERLVAAAPYVLKELPDTKFLMVGDGELRESITNLVRETGLTKNFLFTGKVPHHKIPLHVGASNICTVLKEKYISGSPLKLYEYMACARPVLATLGADYGFEILEENGAGILVDIESPQKIGDEIVKILKNPELQRKMGQAGLKVVEERFTWKKKAEAVLRICQEAIEEYQKK